MTTIIAASPEISGETPEIDKRADYIKGLRAVADLLEAHPELPLPYDGDSTKGLCWIELAPAGYDLAGLFASLIPGTVQEDASKLVGNVHGLRVDFVISGAEMDGAA